MSFSHSMLPKRLADSRDERFLDQEAIGNAVSKRCSLTSYLRVALSDVELFDDGTLVAAGAQYNYLQGVHEELCALAGIPLGYGYRIPWELFVQNFDAMKIRNSVGITLCIVGDKVVGVAKASYSAVRTGDALAALDLERGWELESGTVSDLGVKINLLIPNASVEPTPGDRVKVGIEIRNSETGGASLRATLFTHRLVCSNGATLRRQEGVVYWQSHRQRTYAKSLEAFAENVCQIKARAQSLAEECYANVMEKRLQDAQFVSLFRALHRRLGARSQDRLEAEQILGVERGERLEIEKTVRERQRFTPPESTDLKLFDVHNRLTASARDRGILLKQSLEELGGTLLTQAV